MSEKKEISCDLWRRGEAAAAQNGGPPVARCSFYESGRCKHKAGPLICPTVGLRSILR